MFLKVWIWTQFLEGLREPPMKTPRVERSDKKLPQAKSQDYSKTEYLLMAQQRELSSCSWQACVNTGI